MKTHISMDLYRCQNPDGSAKDWAVAIEEDAAGNIWQYVAFGKAGRIAQHQAKQVGSRSEVIALTAAKVRKGYARSGNYRAELSSFPGAPSSVVSRPPAASAPPAEEPETDYLLHVKGEWYFSSPGWEAFRQGKLQGFVTVNRVSESLIELQAEGCVALRLTQRGSKVVGAVKREHGWKVALAVMAIAKLFGLFLADEQSNEVKPTEIVETKTFLVFPGIAFREIEDAAALLGLIPKRIRLSELKTSMPGVQF